MQRIGRCHIYASPQRSDQVDAQTCKIEKAPSALKLNEKINVTTCAGFTTGD